MPPEQRPPCSATTKRGTPCRNRAAAGSTRCSSHRVQLDPAAVDTFTSMLRAGNYVDVAARAAGLEAAELDELLEQVGQASAEGEAANVARIAAAARDNWQAAAWLLERQFPQRWGRPALRLDERPAPAPTLVTDSVDELAEQRAARRAGARK